MKKFLFILFFLTATLLGAAPVGIGWYTEKVYRETLDHWSGSDHSQAAVEVTQYQKSYLKSELTLKVVPKVQASHDSIVLTQTIWHLPWLMHFGEYHRQVFQWQDWKHFELPLSLIQTNDITLYYADTDPKDPKANKPPKLFSLRDWIASPNQTAHLFGLSFLAPLDPWLPAPQPLFNTVITLNQNLEVQYHSWFKHDIQITDDKKKVKYQITHFNVYFKTNSLISAVQSDISFEQFRSLDKRKVIKNWVSRIELDLSQRFCLGHLKTSIDQLLYDDLLSIEKIDVAQDILEKNNFVDINLSQKIAQLKIKPVLKPKENAVSLSYKPVILNFSLTHLSQEGLNAFIQSAEKSSTTDNAAFSNALKKIVENKPELILNQFTLGYPEGLFEIKGTLGLGASKVALDLHAIQQSLVGQFTLRIPKARFVAVLTKKVEDKVAAEMAANTDIGHLYKNMAEAERQTAIQDHIKVTLDEFLKSHILVEEHEQYIMEMKVEQGQILINGKPFPDLKI